MLRVYNTLTRKKEIFKPRKGKKVDLFVCGPTVYEFSHIGHARTYVAFDVIARYLTKSGYSVRYLQNITDIDDKIIKRAQERRLDPLKLAHESQTAYLEDVSHVGIRSVWKYAAASQHIPEIIRQIDGLVKKEFAYETETGVYFSVEKFKDYGKLSGQKVSEMFEAVRIEADPTKRHFADFALWKKAKSNEPSWDSPWGKGRPGWHIEDTAIAEKYFGPQYDIHGGAIDLIFPHHESEIAQMEALSGKKPYVRYWLHTGLLNIRGDKMAKSLGNFIQIRDLFAHHRQEAFRLLVLQTHYRSPIDYDELLMRQAEAALERIREFTEKLRGMKSAQRLTPRAARPGRAGGKRASQVAIQRIVIKSKKRFIEAMDDDFDTPRALAVFFDLIRAINPRLDAGTVLAAEKKNIEKFLDQANEVFGIIPKRISIEIPEEVKKMVVKRERMRKEKRFFDADAVRRRLMEQGWYLEDTAQGPRLKRLASA